MPMTKTEQAVELVLQMGVLLLAVAALTRLMPRRQPPG